MPRVELFGLPITLMGTLYEVETPWNERRQGCWTYQVIQHAGGGATLRGVPEGNVGNGEFAAPYATVEEAVMRLHEFLVIDADNLNMTFSDMMVAIAAAEVERGAAD